MQLQHLHRVAEIEMKNLVGLKNVHLGEGSRFQQIVDCCALGSRAARQLDRLVRRVGPPEPAAFNRMRLQLQHYFDLIGSHRFRW